MHAAWLAGKDDKFVGDIACLKIVVKVSRKRRWEAAVLKIAKRKVSSAGSESSHDQQNFAIRKRVFNYVFTYNFQSLYFGIAVFLHQSGIGNCLNSRVSYLQSGIKICVLLYLIYTQFTFENIKYYEWSIMNEVL